MLFLAPHLSLRLFQWPICVVGSDVAEAREAEFEREKLISQLLFSIQSFAYSCCSEAAEVRRLYASASKMDAGQGDHFHSKFGLREVLCDGRLVVMPPPTTDDEGGERVFDGRLGKLRYTALAVITAASAVSRELVQMCFQFPVTDESSSQPLSLSRSSGGRSASNTASSSNDDYDEVQVPRAPMVYPLLCGHILTHTVVAMCAICGRKRAMDLLSGGVGLDGSKNTNINMGVGSLCVNSIKLGYIARCLQVLLGAMELDIERKEGKGAAGPSTGNEMSKKVITEGELLTIVSRYMVLYPPTGGWRTGDDYGCEWNASCAKLVFAALGGSSNTVVFPASSKMGFEKFRDACLAAKIAGETFLSDTALILQILAPGFLNSSDRPRKADLELVSTVEGLALWLGLEDMVDMLDSERTACLVAHWYKAGTLSPPGREVDEQRLTEVQTLLTFRPELPSCDWPVASMNARDVCKITNNGALGIASSGSGDNSQSQLDRAHAYLSASPLSFAGPGLTSKRMLCESPTRSGSVAAPTHISPSRVNPAVAPNLVPQKCVPLMGALVNQAMEFAYFSQKGDPPARISNLPVSYTDLYAQLGVLIPESDQTAVCLICGTVLNAAGKGECTKHAVKCGSGCGLFFLLQECVGLILHGKKAAYVHSPYVDSHGETPQYRGRPLNLDMGRYEILYEMWAGHSIRERVMSERANSRQVIIANFY
jgi:hypothetical protein